MEYKGRLESVVVDGFKRYNLAYGRIRDTNRKVIMYYGNNYQTGDCLVRFLFDQRDPNFLIGSFITSAIPEDFQGLSPEQYVLIGKVEPEWRKNIIHEKGYVSFSDIIQYYDPREFGFVIYISEGSTNNRGRLSINKYSTFSLHHANLRYVIAHGLPYPNRSSRVILAEDPEDLKNLEELISNKKMTPIIMEPLKQKILVED